MPNLDYLHHKDGRPSVIALIIMNILVVLNATFVLWFVGAVARLIQSPAEFIIDPNWYVLVGTLFGGAILGRAGQMAAPQVFQYFRRDKAGEPPPPPETKEEEVKVVEQTEPVVVAKTVPGTTNFSLSEFTCNDAARTPVPVGLYTNLQRLMDNLQIIRDEMNRKYGHRGHEIKLIISSGYRTKAYNTQIGGSSISRHMDADAADMYAEMATPRELFETINEVIRDGKVTPGGLSLYERSTNHVHYDARGVNARW
jgi:hypothetical protein